jgi:hypothetical protein
MKTQYSFFISRSTSINLVELNIPIPSIFYGGGGEERGGGGGGGERFSGVERGEEGGGGW